jgi:F-type H+-transporting ATPase subunit gamma
MQTLQKLERQLKSAHDLKSVVRTMKSLAAVSIHQYEEATSSLNEYFDSVEMGLRAALRTQPLSAERSLPKQTLIIMFGSDQGMAGRFNESLFDFIRQELADLSSPQLLTWAAGIKAHGLLVDHFGEVDQSFTLPPSAESIASRVQEILLQLAAVRERHGELRLILFHNRPAGGAAYHQTRVDLLPPDRAWLDELDRRRWPGRQLPLFTIPWDQLFAALVGEYLFISLYRAFAASMAAEHAARLASMQRAERNIDETMEELTRTFHTLRQSTISEELFDVLTGFAAQKSPLQKFD